MLSRLAVVCANCNLEAERHASGAAESGSEARASAVSRRLHAIDTY